MALRVSKKFKFKGITWKSGHVYRFKYNAWMVDPNPLIILLYKFSGTHPNTGRQWRFLQGINLNYVPRKIRRNFIKNWKEKLESSNDVYLTWTYVKSRYPAIVKSQAIRRYFYSPNYYITKVEEIPVENMEDVVIGSMAKDLSRKVKFSLTRKFKKTNKQPNQKKDFIGNILKKFRKGN